MKQLFFLLLITVSIGATAQKRVGPVSVGGSSVDTSIITKDYTTQVTGKPAHLNARYPSWHIESPTSTDDIFLLKVPYAITITSIDYAVSGSSPSLTFDIVFGSTADAGSPTEVIGTDVTTTSTTGGSTASFNDATVPANQWIRLKPSATSGTINRLALVINYTID